MQINQMIDDASPITANIGYMSEKNYASDGERLSDLRVTTVMAIQGFISVVLLFVAALLVYKVYKLVKFTDIPQLFSVLSIFMSLICNY